MLRFTIRDLLWLTAVIAVALLLARQQRTHHQEMEALKAKNEQLIAESDGLQWQLMHSNDELKAEGFIVQSDNKRFQVTGPSKHGFDSVTITRIKNGEAIQIMAGDKDVTAKFTSTPKSAAPSAEVEIMAN